MTNKVTAEFSPY